MSEGESSIFGSFNGRFMFVRRIVFFLTAVCLSFIASAQAVDAGRADGRSQQQMTDRVAGGLSRLLRWMQVNKQDFYPLWPAATSPIEFIVFNNKRFYSGVFFAHLIIFADVTKSEFQIGDHPQLIGIMAENLKSWGDVNAFLATNNTSFRLPLDTALPKFTGCNTFEQSNNGATGIAVIIVDITETRSFSEIDSCVYSALMGAFGFDPKSLAADVLSDLRILETLYNLPIEERTADRIVSSIVDKVLKTNVNIK